jgi:signal transduction histidine kinase
MQGREQTSVLLESLTGNFIAGAFFLLLPIGLLAILVAVMTLRRGLRPLRQVSAAARRVGPAQPGARLPTIDLPDEVFPLVQTVNDALSRLDQALLGQRRFMAEAAHALRTPLAVLTARLDMMEDQQGLDGLRHDADRMGRLVGQLLRMARLENMEIDVSSAVSLHDVVVGERGRITVLDEGPGIPPGERDHIFERFVRGPHADEGGAGLGLAIVAEIALAHHGAAWVEDRPEGGSAFVLDLKA